MNPLYDLVDQKIQISKYISAIPIVHGSLEFTILVKKYFYDFSPEIVALELPDYLYSYINKVLPFLDSYPVLKIKTEVPNYLVFEPLEPLVEALRNCYELNIPFFLVDSPPIHNFRELYYRNIDSFPDTIVLNYLSLEELYKIYLQNLKENFNPIDFYRELYIAIQLKKIESENPNKGILLICGFKHLKNIINFYNQELNKLEELIYNISEKISFSINFNFEVEIYSLANSSPEILSQPGYYNNLWLEYRNEPKKWKYISRIRLQREVYRLAKNEYESQSGEFIPPQKEKLFFQFARNLSILYRRLIPNPLILVHSAKNFVNDNFAKIFYEKLMNFNKQSSPYEELQLSLDDLGLDSELIRFRTKIFRQEKKTFREIKSKITKEQYEGQWRDLWNRERMCSYPPEDIIIENFSLELRKKALALVKSSEKKVYPFSSSLLDGVDYRETIRNYYKNTIYVMEQIHKDWDFGNVVVIFSDDEEKFNWKNVWWGEHSEEGDMAFYSTPPEEMIVGPGIARCIYGGFMLSYPPGRLSLIWNDYEFRNFRTAKEKLLAAAIIYNQKNTVVYVAEKPHSSKMNYFASRFGQKIIYIPIRTLNQAKLNRIKRFHVLNGHDKRKDAHKYIW